MILTGNDTTILKPSRNVMAEIRVQCRNDVYILWSAAYRPEEENRGFQGTKEEAAASYEEIPERRELEIEG